MSDINIKKEIESLHVQEDFDYFLDFISNQKVKLTKSGFLGPKDCFALNKEMALTNVDAHSKLQHKKYLLLWMFFIIGLSSGLLDRIKEKNSGYLVLNNEIYDFFKTFNKIEKYFFLLKTIWVDCNFRDLKADDYTNDLEQYLNNGLNSILEAPLQKTVSDKNFSFLDQITHYFKYLAWWDITLDKKTNRKVKNIQIKPIGDYIIPIIAEHRPLFYWNNVAQFNELYLYSFDLFLSEDEDVREEEIEKQLKKRLEESFIDTFKPFFGDSLNKEISIPEAEVINGNYIFRVQLIGFDVWRDIAISGDDSLEDLHFGIQEAFEFDDDHLFAFYLDGKFHSDISLNDERGGEPPFAFEYPVNILGLQEGQKLVYLFDFGDEWRFEVTLNEIKEVDIPLNEFKIIKSHGKAPEQYPDWDEDEE